MILTQQSLNQMTKRILKMKGAALITGQMLYQCIEMIIWGEADRQLIVIENMFQSMAQKLTIIEIYGDGEKSHIMAPKTILQKNTLQR